MPFVVFADDICNKYGCATCVYENASWKWKYDLKSNGTGSAELRFSYELKGNWTAASAAYAPKLKSSTLIAKNFINSETNKLFCPEELYVMYDGASGEVFGEPKEESVTKKTTPVSLLSAESSNNNLTIGESLSNSCSYEFGMIQGQNKIKVTITPVGEELKFELSDGFKINTKSNGYDLTVSDFTGGACPKIYGQCGASGENKYCSVSKTQHFDVLNRDEAQDGYEEQEAGKNGDFDIEFDDPYKDIGSNNVNCDTLGTLRKDLNSVFNIIKIVAPILIIVFSIYDFIKAAAGKVEGEMKKAFSKLLKRIIFAVILFFLPTILDYFLGLVNPGYTTCINS